MKNNTPRRKLFALWWMVVTASGLVSRDCRAAGVTVITHGYASDVNSWITAMADDMSNYHGFPGASLTIYKITLTYNNGYYYSVTRTNGSAPPTTDSGEIIVKLDWSQMAGGTAPYDFSTYDVAGAASYILLQTNAIAELGGHALAEFPLHLIGHSRGGSLVSEISRLLGTNGVWIDHLTTLDPHPLNNDGNSDFFLPTDATSKQTYANVLFADNYWQDLGSGFDPHGEAVAGAYVRQLFNLSGGYNNVSGLSPDHSNVHLWYHGTIDLATPTSDGAGGASITGAERANWWVPDETSGAVAGFYLSLIGGGNRLSSDQPFGPGYSEIRDGYNQWWSLGAGSSANRTALTSNNGNWPSLIKFNRTDTNQVAQGQSASVNYYYQWAGSNANAGNIGIYLDDDRNPLNTNQSLLKQINILTNGASYVSYQTVSVPFDATNAAPGWHALFAKITGGGQTRYLYAPELVQVISSRQPPSLDIVRLNASQVRIGVNGIIGQTLILESAGALTGWRPVATNTLVASRWIITDSSTNASGTRFYRAVVGN